MSVHHAVLLAWVGPPPEGCECRHLNGDPGDNRLSNLAWGTKAENAADKKKHGTHLAGEAVGTAKLSEVDVRLIRRTRCPASVLAKVFGVSYSTIRLVQTGKSWSHVKD